MICLYTQFYTKYKDDTKYPNLWTEDPNNRNNLWRIQRGRNRCPLKYDRYVSPPFCITMFKNNSTREHQNLPEHPRPQIYDFWLRARRDMHGWIRPDNGALNILRCSHESCWLWLKKHEILIRAESNYEVRMNSITINLIPWKGKFSRPTFKEHL